MVISQNADSGMIEKTANPESSPRIAITSEITKKTMVGALKFMSKYLLLMTAGKNHRTITTLAYAQTCKFSSARR